MPSFLSTRAAVRAAAALAAMTVIAGCVSAAGASPAGGSSADKASPAPSNSQAVPTKPATTLYLRAWQSQALAPQLTFSWLPQVTIDKGVFIDGQVAVPAIYPGPLWIQPSTQTINQAGIDAIVAEAGKQGLFEGKVDFRSSLAVGAVSAHLTMIVDGKTYELSGDPAALEACKCTPTPGTPEGFAAFWQKLTSLSMWLPDDLGPSAPYAPERLAVLATPPSSHRADGITPTETDWPLTTPFSKLGTPLGNETFRCVVLTDTDMAKLLPVIKQSNQLTQFRDGAGTVDTLQVRVLVPGEPSPCA